MTISSELFDIDRFKGCLLGMACGDAVGTTVEFSPRGTFPPVTEMTGGGPFYLKAGKWTDDTSMALCLAHSLLYMKGFDAKDQMNRYLNWRDHGYMSSTGRCFDIGNTVNTALNKYQSTQDPFAGSEAPMTAGNGGIMRIAPVPMFYAEDIESLLLYAGASSRTTHGAPEAVECAKLFSAQIRSALLGRSKDEVLLKSDFVPTEEKVTAISRGAYIEKSESQIKGSGYVVEALEAALWCFYHTDSFETAVLKAANLGDDADTTAAIVGQIAGAYYGVEGIPQKWLSLLYQRDEIEGLATSLFNDRHKLTNKEI